MRAGELSPLWCLAGSGAAGPAEDQGPESRGCAATGSREIQELSDLREEESGHWMLPG